MHPTPVPRPALLLLALVLAGCADPGEAPGAPEAPGDAFSLVPLPGDARGGEPHLAVSPDGRALYATALALGGDAPRAAAWRSDDGGRTWRALPDPAGEAPSVDVALAVAPDGVVHGVSLDPPASALEAGPCTSALRSDDRGETWTRTPGLCAARIADRPWVAADAGGAYLLQRLATQTYEWWRSADGTAWTRAPVPLAPANAGPLASGGGVVAFAAARPSGLALASTADGGATWREETVTTGAVDGRWPMAALDEQGALAAWLVLREGAAGLAGALEANEAWDEPFDVLASTRDAGGAWGEPVTLDAEGLNAHVWASAREGRRLVTWLHTDDVDGEGRAKPDAQWRLRAWLDGDLHEAPVVVDRGALRRGDVGDFLATALLPGGTVVAVLPLPALEEGEAGFDAPLHALVWVPGAPGDASGAAPQG